MSALKLHIGCGSTVVDGWVNIDKSPGVALARVPGLRPLLGRVGVLREDQVRAVFPSGIVRADVLRGLDYPSGSADFVYSSHLIEHMARWQAARFLQECRRVLRPGGRLRLATPDLAELASAYVERRSPDGVPPADWFMESMLTFQEHDEGPVKRVARRLMTAPHQWLYDEESLGRAMQEAGFADVERRDFLDSALPDIAALEQRPGSLFMEATAP